MPPAIAIPLLAVGGMISQNVANKANIKNAENARANAQQQVGQGTQNALNFWQNQPGLQAPNLGGGPQQFGGGVVGGPSGGTVTGGQYGMPQGGQQITPQIIENLLARLGGTQGGGITPPLNHPGLAPPRPFGAPQILGPDNPLAGFAGEPRQTMLPGGLR